MGHEEDRFAIEPFYDVLVRGCIGKVVDISELAGSYGARVCGSHIECAGNTRMDGNGGYG